MAETEQRRRDNLGWAPWRHDIYQKDAWNNDNHRNILNLNSHQNMFMLCVIRRSVIMLSVVMPNVIMQSVVMQDAVMAKVVASAPLFSKDCFSSLCLQKIQLSNLILKPSFDAKKLFSPLPTVGQNKLDRSTFKFILKTKFRC